jgi:hypothetical protein
MLTNVYAGETKYITMPFEGDAVQYAEVYTGEPVVLKCEKEGELYIWGYGKNSSSGASMTSAPIETTENTYKVTNTARWYYDDWYYIVGVKNGEDEVYSKYLKLRVLYSRGDVDGDADRDKVDAAMVLKYLGGALELDEKQMYAADFNEDGKVNLLDAVNILKK